MPQSDVAHHERNQRDVGHPVGEDVRTRSVREQMRNSAGVDRPVHERQIAPHLVEHNTGRRNGAGSTGNSLGREVKAPQPGPAAGVSRITGMVQSAPLRLSCMAKT